MKGLLKFVVCVFLLSVLQTSVRAQQLIIDSSRKSVDISGNFNTAEISLPAVKKPPEFPGGKKAWREFLLSNINIKIPFSNKAVPGIYKVMIRFLINHDGKLLETGAGSNCGYGMESEVIRCINKSPDWIPAETSSGRKVNFILRTIVVFNVKQNDIVISFQ